ncbi:hypothetical protein AB1Y20_007921 [Prymnesium parvum]|uniref:Uncharacterized protein n=1 Tax=Prymnesium parvum TaxID=97485 RepID=A0AB34IU39_PRYPA
MCRVSRAVGEVSWGGGVVVCPAHLRDAGASPAPPRAPGCPRKNVFPQFHPAGRAGRLSTGRGAATARACSSSLLSHSLFWKIVLSEESCSSRQLTSAPSAARMMLSLGTASASSARSGGAGRSSEHAGGARGAWGARAARGAVAAGRRGGAAAARAVLEGEGAGVGAARWLRRRLRRQSSREAVRAAARAAVGSSAARRRIPPAQTPTLAVSARFGSIFGGTL